MYTSHDEFKRSAREFFAEPSDERFKKLKEQYKLLVQKDSKVESFGGRIRKKEKTNESEVTVKDIRAYLNLFNEGARLIELSKILACQEKGVRYENVKQRLTPNQRNRLTGASLRNGELEGILENIRFELKNYQYN